MATTSPWAPTATSISATGATTACRGFTPQGKFIAKWGTGEGKEDGQFINPYGIAVDAAGDVFVADTGNPCVQKFTAEGNFC